MDKVDQVDEVDAGRPRVREGHGWVARHPGLRKATSGLSVMKVPAVCLTRLTRVGRRFLDQIDDFEAASGRSTMSILSTLSLLAAAI